MRWSLKRAAEAERMTSFVLALADWLIAIGQSASTRDIMRLGAERMTSFILALAHWLIAIGQSASAQMTSFAPPQPISERHLL